MLRVQRWMVMGMATCNDCLHLDVCYMVEHYGVDIAEERQEYDCYQFKNRSDYKKVVRCKNCKHRYTAASGVIFCTQHLTMSANDDDFCSYGERREGE